MIRQTVRRLGIYFCLSSMLCSLVACGNEERLQLIVKVQDQEGHPVEGASVRVSKKLRKLTDENGVIRGNFKKQLNITTGAFRDGYYRSNAVPVYPYDDKFDAKDPVVIVLKEKKNPIPMFVKRWDPGSSRGLKIPGAIGVKVSYDFLRGDWVKPFGKGVRSDIFFKREGDWGGNWRESYHRKLLISFPNEHDGLFSFEVPLPLFEQSELRSGYQAPLVGYLNRMEQVTSRLKGGPHESTKKKERNYYFRIRTVVDAKGEIVSCHYGKMYGDFMSLIYYVNLTPNDRNVEFDIERNLFETRDKIDRP